MDYVLENWMKEIEENISKGIIDKNLKPIKCPKCNSKDFEDKNEHYIGGGHGIAEFDRHCKKCNTICGSWSHGSWQP